MLNSIPFADEAFFVPFSHMGEVFVFVEERFLAESADWVNTTVCLLVVTTCFRSRVSSHSWKVSR